MNNKKDVIQICLGSSCFSRGNARNLDVLKNYIKENNLSAEVELKGHLCAELCNRGPIIKINDDVYEGVTESSLIKILETHFNEK